MGQSNQDGNERVTNFERLPGAFNWELVHVERVRGMGPRGLRWDKDSEWGGMSTGGD